jgi:hypothetical protein
MPFFLFFSYRNKEKAIGIGEIAIICRHFCPIHQLLLPSFPVYHHKVYVLMFSKLSSSAQAWNMSTRRATAGFFMTWFHGLASRDSISLSREFHISAMKSHLQAAILLFTKSHAHVTPHL